MSIYTTTVIILSISLSLLACKGQEVHQPDTTASAIKSETYTNVATALDNRIWVIFQDTKGDYWYGSNRYGVYHFDGTILNRYTTKDGLVDNVIRGIQEDAKGNIYIETPSGISKYDGQQFITLEPISSPSNEWRLEPNDLWFKYNANDLYRYDGEQLYELQLPRQDLFEAFGREVQGLSFDSNNKSPYAIFGFNKDKDGNLWFGTVTAGVFRYDGDSFMWIAEDELSTLPDGRVPGVRSMLQDKDGYFWLSNFISKYSIDEDSLSYKKHKAVDIPESIEESKILYFNSGIVAQNGDLWMTTYGGGVWHYDGESLSNIEIQNGIEDVLLITIYQDRDGTFWLGSDNDGVYRGDGVNFKKYDPMETR